jgi:hypothetical protein
MQIFELTQPKKTLKEYDPSRPPPKKNFGAGVGPGVQPQYTATPKMKGAAQPGPAPQLPAPAANQVATTAPAPKLQTVAAPAQRGGPTAAKQLGTNYDPNVVDVDAKEVPNTPAGPALAAPTPATTTQPAAVTPTTRQSSQGIQSYQNTANIPVPPPPKSAATAKPAAVAPAPSTPGVKGSRTRAIIGALGNKLQQKLAADAGLSVPDTGDDQPYGDQRAAASKALATSISQLAREELAKWNQGLMQAVQQAGVSSPAQLPAATKQALARSLMNQVYTNFLQGRLGKKYKDLPQYVDGKVQQEAAAQVAKLDNAIRAILNFNAPVSDAQAQLQRWQDLSQATYDMRSLLQFHPKKLDYTRNQKMPTLQPTPNGLQIGSFALGQSDQTSMDILRMIMDLRNKVTGAFPTVSLTPTGQWQIGSYPLDPSNPRDLQLTKILKTEKDRLNKTTTAESLTWSRGFDPSRTLLKKIRQL